MRALSFSQALSDAQAQWHLTLPKLIEETAVGWIFHVRAPGQEAALKLIKPGKGQSEAAAPDLLQAWNGQGAARLLARGPNRLLLEWLHGPSLGDLTRSGKDDEATRCLAHTASVLHQVAVPKLPCLKQLSNVIQPMFELTKGQIPNAQVWPDIITAQNLARKLMHSAPAPIALHGDLHHDNVLNSARGWLAIDPKGIWGDPAFETANAFRNPKGAPAIVSNPDRIDVMARTFSNTLNLPMNRILSWAAAKTVLSTAWGISDANMVHTNLKMLPCLLAAAAKHPPL